MALTSVRVQFNGTWYDMALDSATGLYKATVTAPSTPQDDVPILVRAINSGGYQAEVEATADVRWEIISPVVAITSPTEGSWYTNAQTPVVFTLTDEENGSGIDLDSLAFVLDGETFVSTSPGMVCTASGNGYACTYTPPAALSDGAHSVTISVSDLAGNAATPVSLSWNIDTVGPNLEVVSPAAGLITNDPALTISGTASDAASGLVSVTINESPVTVTDGAFSQAVTLTEGTNSFTIVATDAVGHTSTVERTVLLDTVAPAFQSVHIRPSLDAEPLGDTFIITVVMKPPKVTPNATETVTGTVNGEPVIWTEGPAYTWTATVERSESDEYAVVLHAADAAGNEADYSITFPCGLESKWTWTPLEYLNYWDLNRIEYNIRYLYDWLQENGYGTRGVTTKTDWTKEDIPLWSDIQRIRKNVDYLQDCYFAIPEWREIVYNNTVDADQMNAFEWDLHLIDLWLSRMVSFRVYSGTIYSGMWP